ncbi:hypothetical protein RIR_jg31970.t1 [Rhizophagus irregularis DAOM 181602=DAOM 197198]|uniref:Uncharacterized protein n=1 Tax=Rhizophagus irregularis TaxID=588596 RepID=A0A2N1N3I6_9GLOM|nr:hypothetical protein RhiirC2_538025 [Rhizophagus irregularis]GET54254.1 hypothetical protein RIR_jg31970.t1 [Rhizophagus irregularis DAOM 181602=DAOM 197198]
MPFFQKLTDVYLCFISPFKHPLLRYLFTFTFISFFAVPLSCKNIIKMLYFSTDDAPKELIFKHVCVFSSV